MEIALTYPKFDLDHLEENVARTVLAAAVTDGDPCNRNFEGGEYNWDVETGSKLVYLAKKDGDPTPTNYDFKIEFGDGKPRVWVEDGSKENVRAALDNALSQDGRKYVLTIRMWGGSAFAEYGQDAVAKNKAIRKALSPSWAVGKTVSAYTLTCATATLLCESGKAILTGGMGTAEALKGIVYEIPGCAISAVGGILTYQAATALGTKVTVPSALLWATGPLAMDYLKVRSLRGGSESILVKWSKGPFKATIGKITDISKKFNAGKTADLGDAWKEIAKILKGTPSTVPGVKYKKIPLTDVTGIGKSQADRMYDILNKISNVGDFADYQTVNPGQAIERVEKYGKSIDLEQLLRRSKIESKYLLNVLDSIRTGKTVEDVDPADLKKLGEFLQKVSNEDLEDPLVYALKESGKLKDFKKAANYKELVNYIGRTEDYTKRLGKKAAEEVDFKTSLLCGAVGAGIASVTTYAMLHSAIMKAYEEIYLDVYPNYDSAVEISTKQISILPTSGKTVEIKIIPVGGG